MTQQSDSTIQQDEQLTILLTTVAGNNDPIFITGNFNHWQVGDKRFQFQKKEDGVYVLQLPNKTTLPDILEYKYVRGGWESEELDQYGNEITNRTVNTQTIKDIKDCVPFWKKNGHFYYSKDFYPNIEVISEAFEIPQLIKTRRIAALLPYDYYTSEKRYPVLYLQDGQNLFDDHAPYGSWGVDKRLALLAQRGLSDLIIISIDHAKEERLAEYTPSTKTQLGSGSGKKYVRFLADTLKPYVDNHFRTKPNRAHTGIGGSSMGGLISIYAGLTYPEVYSKLLIFSPSLWVAPNIHFHAINFHTSLDTKIYLYGGTEESKNMVPNMNRFKAAIEQQQLDAKINFNLSIDPKGKHNEARWGQEFPKAVEWLFFNEST